jgi:hypothetical protein
LRRVLHRGPPHHRHRDSHSRRDERQWRQRKSRRAARRQSRSRRGRDGADVDSNAIVAFHGRSRR